MIRPLIDTLRYVDAGQLLDDAAQEMNALVTQVLATGKAGTLTITLSVRPATAGTIAVSGKVSTKEPKEEVMETLFFPSPEGNLSIDNPIQQKMGGLRQVDESKGPLKTVAG